VQTPAPNCRSISWRGVAFIRHRHPEDVRAQDRQNGSPVKNIE
jgi:hypothetical protein